MPCRSLRRSECAPGYPALSFRAASAAATAGLSMPAYCTLKRPRRQQYTMIRSIARRGTATAYGVRERETSRTHSHTARKVLRASQVLACEAKGTPRRSLHLIARRDRVPTHWTHPYWCPRWRPREASPCVIAWRAAHGHRSAQRLHKCTLHDLRANSDCTTASPRRTVAARPCRAA